MKQIIATYINVDESKNIKFDEIRCYQKTE